ncbi:MAG: glutamyl-tRNA reductase [Luminiphilus sp.]|nr:glutamyl-tRNA reductase [Luminiphilus sp.]
MLQDLIAIGINHDSASIETRERVAFAPEDIAGALEALIAATPFEEAVILSTCNRTEIYGVMSSGSEPLSASDALLAWVSTFHGLSEGALATCTYRHHGAQAATHLVRVAAGLNSLVLGEPQIFGQLKSAFAVAEESGAIGSRFASIFPGAFRIAKKVRTDTAIGENPVSVAYASVDLAGHIFSDLSKRTALLLGAGETIELVARHLCDANLGRLMIANRTLARAQSMAEEFDAAAIMLADVPERLAEADIVISATASQLPVLGKGAVESAIRKRHFRPMLMVDLAVPRDIEPEVAELSDVYLYTVDDLRDVIEENLRLRASEASKADGIVLEGVAQLEEDLRGRQSADVVKKYRESALSIQEVELARALKALERGETGVEVVRRLARDLTNKLIHAPTAGLRHLARSGDDGQVDQAKALLGLDVGFDDRTMDDEKPTLQ